MWIDSKLATKAWKWNYHKWHCLADYMICLARMPFYYIFIKPMTAYRLETKRIEWIQMQEITTSQGALSATELVDSNIPSDHMWLPPGLNSVELRFLCEANNIGGTARIYAAKKTGTGMTSDVVLIASLAITSGGQTTTRDGSTMYYIDTIVSTGNWMKNIATADNSGNDRMARVGFDTLGYLKLFVRLEFTGSHTWYVDITGF